MESGNELIECDLEEIVSKTQTFLYTHTSLNRLSAKNRGIPHFWNIKTLTREEINCSILPIHLLL